MADTVYNVRVRYDLDKSGAEAGAASLARTFTRLSEAIGAAFAVHRVLDFGKRIVGLKAEMENMRVALASMLVGFRAPGLEKGADRFQKAMMVSRDMIQQIILQAAKLPTTAEEVVEIMRAAMPGGMEAGKAVLGPGSVMEMAKKLAVAGFQLQIPGGATTVSREFQAMMEGRAMTRNDLFARLRPLMGEHGMTAKEFNALTPDKRWDTVEKALSRLVDPALPEYAKTWRAISTTTVTWAQQIMRVASEGVFVKLKEHLRELNNWFQKNQVEIERFASDLGSKVGDEFGKLLDRIKAVVDFLISNRSTLLPLLQAFAALGLGGAIAGAGRGKGGVNGAIGGAVSRASLGGMLNTVTGGDGFTGALMSAAAALTSFGGIVGVVAGSFLALQSAVNFAASAIDQSHKDNINRGVEGARLMGAYKEFDAAHALSDRNNQIVRSIIRETRMNSGYMGAIDNQRFVAYMKYFTNLNFDDDNTIKSARRVFDYVAKQMRDTQEYGPEAPNPLQKAMQKMYDHAVPRKQDVNVNVTIRQDIVEAQDPDRILVKTKQAIEDALIRPIESGHNRFAILR